MVIKRNTVGQFVKGSHWREPQKFRDSQWLEENYISLNRSSGEIAAEFGVSDAAVLYWLKKHRIERRTTSEARGVKYWGVSGPDNPMWNKKGELNPRWLGGVTPERQSFYTSAEWKDVCKEVYRRDKGFCQRCTLHRDEIPDIPFHIHHIVSFSDKELRSDPSNLVLLCEPCHHFVHSKRNKKRDFLPKK